MTSPHQGGNPKLASDRDTAWEGARSPDP